MKERTSGRPNWPQREPALDSPEPIVNPGLPADLLAELTAICGKAFVRSLGQQERADLVKLLAEEEAQ